MIMSVNLSLAEHLSIGLLCRRRNEVKQALFGSDIKNEILPVTVNLLIPVSSLPTTMAARSKPV
jgi:hypothetical protein